MGERGEANNFGSLSSRNHQPDLKADETVANNWQLNRRQFNYFVFASTAAAILPACGGGGAGDSGGSPGTQSSELMQTLVFNDQAVANQQVTITNDADSNLIYQATTDAAGQFTVANIATGTYTVSVSNGYWPYTLNVSDNNTNLGTEMLKEKLNITQTLKNPDNTVAAGVTVTFTPTVGGAALEAAAIANAQKVDAAANPGYGAQGVMQNAAGPVANEVREYFARANRVSAMAGGTDAKDLKDAFATLSYNAKQAVRRAKAQPPDAHAQAAIIPGSFSATTDATGRYYDLPITPGTYTVAVLGATRYQQVLSSGDSLLSEKVLSLDVTDKTRSTTEDTAMTFSAVDFADADGDTPTHVKITDIVGLNGSLRKSGTALQAGDQIAQADLANLTFEPTSNFNTDNSRTATFKFKTAKDGGTIWSNEATLNITITAAEDTVAKDTGKLPGAADRTLQETATATTKNVPLDGIFRNPDNVGNETAIDQTNTTDNNGGLKLRVIDASPTIFGSLSIGFDGNGKPILIAKDPSALGTSTVRIGARAGTKAEITADIDVIVQPAPTTLGDIINPSTNTNNFSKTEGGFVDITANISGLADTSDVFFDAAAIASAISFTTPTDNGAALIPGESGTVPGVGYVSNPAISSTNINKSAGTVTFKVYSINAGNTDTIKITYARPGQAVQEKSFSFGSGF